MMRLAACLLLLALLNPTFCHTAPKQSQTNQSEEAQGLISTAVESLSQLFFSYLDSRHPDDTRDVNDIVVEDKEKYEKDDTRLEKVSDSNKKSKSVDEVRNLYNIKHHEAEDDYDNDNDDESFYLADDNYGKKMDDKEFVDNDEIGANSDNKVSGSESIDVIDDNNKERHDNKQQGDEKHAFDTKQQNHNKHHHNIDGLQNDQPFSDEDKIVQFKTTKDEKMKMVDKKRQKRRWGKAGADNSIMADSSNTFRHQYSQPIPISSDLGEYLTKCSHCLVTVNRFECPMHDQVLELQKWTQELQKLISFGCQIGDQCGGSDGKCCFGQDATLQRAIVEMTNTARTTYHSFQSACVNCPRDGEWSAWCEWSGCSTPCRDGVQTRTRQCSNPTPRGQGRQCAGRDKETRPCSRSAQDTNVCDGGWTAWSAWGECSVTCGEGGRRERSRTCTNPAPQGHGRVCAGSPNEVQTCVPPCGPCCVPVHGEWGSWEEVTSCSATWGGSYKRLRRLCDSPSPNKCGQPCHGSNEKTETCQCVPLDGGWSPWGSWTHCVDNQRTRTRNCTNPLPNQCGRYCVGDPCESKTCGCVWQPWGEWSQCAGTCDYATRSRSRECWSSDRRVDCAGLCGPEHTQQEECRLPRIDGQWSSWRLESPCPVTCGQSIERYRRDCNSPAPNQCGDPCPGDNIMTKPCTLRPCDPPCRWETWGRWSGCSKTCGGGQRTRTRQCGPLQRADCHWQCGMDHTDTEPCNQQPCETYRWGPWNEWCPCECRRGLSFRRRVCLSDRTRHHVSINHCRHLGNGKAREEKPCDVAADNTCPPCLREGGCLGRKDGRYPSCTSCEDYAVCRNNQLTVRSCGPNMKWDHFTSPNGSCVHAHSDSCTLAPCIHSCHNKISGAYHKCGSCEVYLDCSLRSTSQEQRCGIGQEFQAHLKTCVRSPSPTCPVNPPRATLYRPETDYLLNDGPNIQQPKQANAQTKAKVTDDETDDKESEVKGSEVDTTNKEDDLKVVSKVGVNYKDEITDKAMDKVKSPTKVKVVGKVTDKVKVTDRVTDMIEVTEKVKPANRGREDFFQQLEREDEELLERLEGWKDEVGERESREGDETIEAPTSSLRVIVSNNKGGEESRKHEQKGEKKSGENDDALSSRLQTDQPACVASCENLKAGHYQSCRGCRFYVLCTKHGRARHLKCPLFKVWDDHKKKCKYHSRTCTSAPKP